METLTKTIEKDPILEFQAAYQMVKEARKDNIWVTFRRENGVMIYRVIKTVCKTYRSALSHIQFQQSLLAPSSEARS